MKILLSWHELKIAAWVGATRQAEAIRLGLPDRHGFEGDGKSIHISGACGEMAYAKGVNKYWGGDVNTFKQPDVYGVQVRTRSETWHDLIVRQADKPEEYYVLVIDQSPVFIVVGGIFGHAARREEWYQSHGGRPPAWFVPQKELTGEAR